LSRPWRNPKGSLSGERCGPLYLPRTIPNHIIRPCRVPLLGREYIHSEIAGIDEGRNRLSLRFLPSKEKPHNGIDEDDAAFVAWGFPENIVGAVIKPILDYLSLMQKANDPDLRALDMVKEVRLAKIVGDPPYDVRLLFIIPETGLSDDGIALARLVSRMRKWFNPPAARLVAWDAHHIYEISVGDYLDTQLMF